MRHDAPPRISAPGWGEVPPTAGLPPRWRDLFARSGRGTLESDICRRFGFTDIEIVASGTAALRIAFTTLAQRHPGRDVVIVPGYTCPLVVLAAAAAGLKAIACDTVPGGFDLDTAHLRRLIDQHTLAIVPTHFGGVLTDVEAIRRAAPGIAIVEDAAQAFGATWNGASVGLAGDIGVFSFGAGKGFTLYEGGALVGREPAMMAALRRTAAELTSPDPLGELGRAVMLAAYHAGYAPLGLRLVYGSPKRKALARDDEIEAAGDRFPPEVEITRVGAFRKRVGCNALGRLDTHLATSRARFDSIATRLAALPGLTVHHPPPNARPSATSLFVTLAEHPERDLLIRALWRSRLGVAKMFCRALPDYPDMQPLLIPSDTPNARALAAGTITISTSALSSRAAENLIVATLEEFGRSAGWPTAPR